MNEELNRIVCNAKDEMELALRQYRVAKLTEMEQSHAWDEWYLKAVANGELSGKNAEERTGNAIIANADLWYELRDARMAALVADVELKLARNTDKMAGRLVMLEVGTSAPSELLETAEESYPYDHA